MPAPSSTVLNTSDQNYHAMLTTEPLDTANIVDVPAEVVHSLRLSDEQRHRHRRGTTLTCAAPVGAHGTARTSRAPSTGAPGPANPTSSCIYTRRLCIAWMYGHTHGWDVASWRGSGESKRIGRWKNRRSPSLLRDRIVLRRATSRLRDVKFSDEICYSLVREIVTFGDSGIEGENALMRTKDSCWQYAGDDSLLLPIHCVENMTKTNSNNSN
jgi:hypothetical protein